MKQLHPIFCLSLGLAAAGPLAAFPYAARPVVVGMDAAKVAGSGGFAMTPVPVAAAFDGGSEQQWYAGGALMTHAPFPGSLQLPGITLPQAPTATVRPLAGTACDVNGDGAVDVIRINEWVGSPNLNTLQVFLNTGNGSFTLGERIDTPNAPGWNEGQHFFEVVAADFDGDGRPDLAILENYDNTNTTPNPDRDEGRVIIRWQENGTQFDAVTIAKSTGLTREGRLVVADVDRDGDNDLLCTEESVWVEDREDFHFRGVGPTLLRNEGGRVFANVDVGARPAGLADVNGDGWPDLADSQAVSLNDRAGGFGARVEELPTAATAHLFRDTNHDGKVDLVRCEGTNLVAYAGNGAGGFAATGQTLVALGGTGLAISAADSDRDGDEDFFVTLAGGGSVFVENVAFHTAPGVRYAGKLDFAGTTQLLAGDFFRDGKPDVLAVTPGQKKLWFLNGSGAFGFDNPVFKLTQGETPHSAVVADFDADGLDDVAYSLPDAGEVRVVRNLAGLVPFTWQDAAVATGVAGVSQLVSGYRGSYDGHPDLLSASATTGQVRWHHQSGGAWATQNLLTPFSPAPSAILAGRLTVAPGDEFTVLTASASQLALRSYQAIFGYGALGTDRIESVNGGPHAGKLLQVDVDGDGRDEVVYINGSGQLSAWNAATGSPGDLPALPSAIRDIAAVDWDRNGRTDILCATATDLFLAYYDARSHGWVQAPMFAGGAGYRAVVVADFTGDGWPDAVAAGDTELRYFRNEPRVGEAIQEPTNRTVNVGTSGLAAGWIVSSKARPASTSNTAEANAVCTGATFQFLRANFISGSWVEGSALTASELSALVSSVRLVAGPGRTVIGSAAPASLEGVGALTIAYHPVLGNLVPISPAADVTHGVELAVRPDALATGMSRLFVRCLGLTGAPQDGLATIVPGEGGSFLLRNSRAAMITLQPVETPLQTWRRSHWNSPASTGAGANDADPDGDGVPNLVEYVTGTDPTAGEPALNQSRGLQMLTLPNAQTVVQCRVILDDAVLDDPHVKVTLLSSTNLASWAVHASRIGGGNWTPLVPGPSFENGLTIYTFSMATTPLQIPNRFFALKVEELP